MAFARRLAACISSFPARLWRPLWLKECRYPEDLRAVRSRARSLEPRSNKSWGQSVQNGQYRAAERCPNYRVTAISRVLSRKSTVGRQLHHETRQRCRLIPAATGNIRRQESVVSFDVVIALALRNLDTAFPSSSVAPRPRSIALWRCIRLVTHAGGFQGLHPEALLFGTRKTTRRHNVAMSDVIQRSGSSPPFIPVSVPSDTNTA
jgi:hypothetical protein